MYKSKDKYVSLYVIWTFHVVIFDVKKEEQDEEINWQLTNLC